MKSLEKKLDKLDSEMDASSITHRGECVVAQMYIDIENLTSKIEDVWGYKLFVWFMVGLVLI